MSGFRTEIRSLWDLSRQSLRRESAAGYPSLFRSPEPGWYGDDGAFHPISWKTVFFIGGHQPDPVSARLTGYDCLSVGIEADN